MQPSFFLSFFHFLSFPQTRRKPSKGLAAGLALWGKTGGTLAAFGSGWYNEETKSCAEQEKQR